jgi:hypothetical protein
MAAALDRWGSDGHTAPPTEATRRGEDHSGIRIPTLNRIFYAKGIVNLLL